MALSAFVTAEPGGPGLRIGVLGTLTINGRPGALQPAQGQLIVALAVPGRDGMSNQRLCHLLGAGPDEPRPPDSLRQLITRTRRQLGTAPDGRPWILHLGSGLYALHPGAVVDAREFESLAASGLRRSDPVQLSRALALVRGQPLTGCYYWWLDVAVIESIRARIVAVAARLADLALAGRDTTATAWACWAGLAADPAAEQLWRSLMRAQDAAGNLAGVSETWNRCLAALAEVAPDGRPHPRTTALYRELLSAPPSHRAG